ncbi:MAG: anaerobic ribonucleoside-triphosphate reductase [Aestuariibacter sp.]|uniref:anaerobic ribonucleoside-triphosphate reductase n=1 Tax=Marisediminitalea aggregata TaxID=634436 RepID=UPI0020CBB3C3|nr:anaerobic ribonucleoside-triphosphate reductase [Marisediminitalea aggregata]MCP3863828.1 anaerobic ribonucleoside-triphosphate reductase [Aestuariibacter sp.]MCP4234612.1 anaerobic ribonucleoside-triphosphate reductase [Aestuariibacter sp.]MCP4527412.1 anaerobic ribonucleoside-triphosphate reductase [Aestuariibacter sp.]MCP4947500.1 anaerobic ribonucleoside-triphosphate reductase [Aestuariibacter sp.]MCP5012047.1 anaerobic ribonucleoside-triphosphate reductase [Aestuariibacter sp.]
MLTLDDKHIKQKLQFIDSYLNAETAADGAKLDANANVTHKNIATLEAELMKDYFIQVNRALVSNKIEELFGHELALEYQRQIEAHEIYVHDETSLKPYCTSITMYPFLLNGLTELGGESKAPQHIESFCGSFVNLVFAISAQFAGAIATVEFLIYFDHFARRDYGENYLNTHAKEVANHLQHVVYALNQPAAARGYQSVFWNISLYDKFYFDSMFGEFVFPDMSKPEWKNIESLQAFFLDWFNNERKRAVLTFPVVTAAMLTKNGAVKDVNFAATCAKAMSEGNSFFVYQSESADSLASCCRLRNEITDNTFSYSLGAGGVSTGSINVITINMNRLIQDGRDLSSEVQKIHKYQVAYRRLIEEYKAAGALPVYDAGFISLDKQFLTLGVNGLAEAAEFLGIEVGNNRKYKDFVRAQLQVIYEQNRTASKHFNCQFNTEFVPAENLGVKNAKWDRQDGYLVNRDCYNSYLYLVENTNTTHIDKFILHGKELNQYLDGGSALHLNLEETLTYKNALNLLNIAAKAGCNYFCVNVKITICNTCEAIDKRTLHACPSCGSEDIDHGTRVIGYLKRVSAFSKGRRDEHALRHYHTHARLHN